MIKKLKKLHDFSFTTKFTIYERYQKENKKKTEKSHPEIFKFKQEVKKEKINPTL